ncbi:DUF4959 domain-containing protein [Dinghuibacter silviterrae]|uniref:Uncharacterized protein DUF5126 n=1 Tax=Dinghuibacter silviterrae TaxID=1539049 RepID=A0A4R8DI94_9BACT|nr:DUF5000 domain-containing lipoprotein [Dinghuibacter silviterrae]TDW96876.1 uncharacterized protein DUF5126 [Dinghuibacter silviterrae]
MRNRITIALLMTLAAAHFGCTKTDSYNTIVSTDKTKPGPVTNVQVTNFSGGAILTYTLPNSQNILYVQANYMINAKDSRQAKSSYYSDTVTVSGFAQSQDYQVTLTVVSRANVSSDPVTVTVHPTTPPYLLAIPTVKMVPDFGGVNITVANPAKAPIGIIVIGPDSTGKLQIIDQNYTNQDSSNFSLRGYDTLPRQFGVYITDQWNNYSDTVYATIKPIYEVEMNKSLFKKYTLPSDVLPFDDQSYWDVQNLWDNNINEPTYNTEQPITPLVWPSWVTFDMGESAKLSRFNLVGRTGDNPTGGFMWGYGTPQAFVLWGRPDVPMDENMPDSTNLPPVGGTTANGWINLGEYHSPAKPSGLPNPQFTSADLAFWQAGFNFNFALTLPKVRYIRFECLTNMGGTNNFFDMNELTFWGDPR